MKALRLDRVWWLVSPQNPIKTTEGMAPLQTRLHTARDILRDHPRMLATDIERELGTVYTADTLRLLKKRFPRTRFVWLMGADNMRQIPCWRRWTDIFALVSVAVLRRPGYVVGPNLGKAARRFASRSLPARAGRRLTVAAPPCWTVLDNPLNPQSSTEIRRGKAFVDGTNSVPVVEQDITDTKS